MEREQLILLKKSMTKKQYMNFMKSQRSQIGLGQQLGTRVFLSDKNYSRKASKRELRQKVKEYY